MKHDYKSSADKTAGEKFRIWLENMTISSFVKAYGDGEATKSAIFMFVNRAYESHMSSRMIKEIFSKCIAESYYNEMDQEPLFKLYEGYANLARFVHGGT